MINIGDTLKRAWQILWNYKMLWVFAFLLAIAGGAGNSGGGGGGGGSSYSGNFANPDSSPFFTDANRPQWVDEFTQWAEQHVVPWFATEEKAIQTVIWMIVGILLLAIVFGLLWSLVRYPSETAILRMVDEHEATGVKYKFKEGWRLGWNRRAFRLWLVDLIIGAPAAGLVLGLIGLFSFFALTIARQAETRVQPGFIVGIMSIGFFFLVFAFVMIVVNLVRHYIVRYAALEETGLWESFRKGWQMFKSYLKDNVLMALVLWGVGMAFGIASLLAMILLIPAYALLTIPGAILAAIPASLAYFITSLFSAEVMPWVVAALVGLVVFFSVVFAPVTLLGGLFKLYTMNIWSLMYRKFKSAGAPPAVFAGPVAPPPLASSED